MTETTHGRLEPTEALVTVAKPGDEKDVTYLSEVGEVRFVEGKAHGVPLSVARKLANGRVGWVVEP